MNNKLKGPVVPIKAIKRPNIPYSLNINNLTSSELDELATKMASPVRGSIPSPFVNAPIYSYTCINGQEYKFHLQKLNDSYFITLCTIDSHGLNKIIFNGLVNNIIGTNDLPNDLKNYLNKFIRNLAFV